MSTFNLGKRETLANNSNKYGYGIEGICVKSGGGYRSQNGTFVKTSVTTNVSHIVKEFTLLNAVQPGQIIVLDSKACVVEAIAPINETTQRMRLLNLENGEYMDKVVDTADRTVGVLWDTFRHPEKAITGGVAPIGLNEFTPEELYKLASKQTSIEELRNPKRTVTLEDSLRAIFQDLMGGKPVTGATGDTAQG